MDSSFDFEVRLEVQNCDHVWKQLLQARAVNRGFCEAAIEQPFSHIKATERDVLYWCLSMYLCSSCSCRLQDDTVRVRTRTGSSVSRREENIAGDIVHIPEDDEVNAMQSSLFFFPRAK